MINHCPKLGCGVTTSDRGFYSPACSRAHAYSGRVDHRKTQEFTDMVRDDRRTGRKTGRCVYPGPQSVRR